MTCDEHVPGFWSGGEENETSRAREMSAHFRKSVKTSVNKTCSLCLIQAEEKRRLCFVVEERRWGRVCRTRGRRSCSESLPAKRSESHQPQHLLPHRPSNPVTTNDNRPWLGAIAAIARLPMPSRHVQSLGKLVEGREMENFLRIRDEGK